jgi:hypothetical protein
LFPATTAAVSLHTIHMAIFLDFVASAVKAFFLFMTFDFVKVTIKSRFHIGSTINFVHYVTKEKTERELCLFL